MIHRPELVGKMKPPLRDRVTMSLAVGHSRVHSSVQLMREKNAIFLTFFFMCPLNAYLLYCICCRMEKRGKKYETPKKRLITNSLDNKGGRRYNFLNEGYFYFLPFLCKEPVTRRHLASHVLG
jgi:hypothetical protein